MKRKIFILKCKILKHKLMRILYKIMYYILAPFAVIYGLIVGIYGICKGMTYDEIKSKYVDKYKEKMIGILRHF